MIPVFGSIVNSVALSAVVVAEPTIELIEYNLGPHLSTPVPAVPCETLTESVNTPTYWVS